MPAKGKHADLGGVGRGGVAFELDHLTLEAALLADNRRHRR
jgi:hypothetical protein